MSKWDSLTLAFCDAYFDGSAYYMWFTGGDGLHMWYSALSNMTGHWQLGYATSPYVTLGLRSVKAVHDAFALEQNYPNPFNPSTTIKYTLPRRSHVTLTIVNTLGQEIAGLVNADLEAGNHEVRFGGSRLASGVYCYKLNAGSFSETKKLALLSIGWYLRMMSA